ncbi:MAG: hypothetical protein KGL93_06710 [Gemmatimonadota bacterium]|nr:hypothetical protein [Gemmatimonadota bacterium]
MYKHISKSSRVLLAVALLHAGVRPLHAQTQAEYRAQIARILPIWRLQRAEAKQRDSLQRRGLPTDTVRVDMITILAEASLDGLARRSAAQAAVELRDRFGSAADSLRSHLFTLKRPGGRVGGGGDVTVGEVNALGQTRYTEDVRPSAELLAQTWAVRGAQLLTGQVSPALRRWLSGSMPVGDMTRNSVLGVRIDVATSPSPLARSCYSGDILACERGLGVADEADPIRGWFTATERRVLVSRAAYLLRDADKPLLDACLQHAVDSACTAAAELIPRSAVPPPFGPNARHMLAQLAMRMGGPGAYIRMLAAPDTVSAQLRAASGVSTDSLVRVWRSTVAGTPLENTTMTPGLAMMSVFWVATCGALALGSSRWR